MISLAKEAESRQSASKPAASRVITQRLKGSGPDMRLANAEPTVPRSNGLRAFYGVSPDRGFCLRAAATVVRRA
jgi:hypothetical protein